MIDRIFSDHIGRPVFATNSSGVKVWTAAYLPFGGVRVSTGTPPTSRFPGQWFQSETGLHQNWMRDYDPTTGRYMQADPLGLVAGASVYGYVWQNPGRYTDPRGENPAAVCLVPGVNGVCVKAAELCIAGAIVGGLFVYDYFFSPDQTLQSSPNGGGTGDGTCEACEDGPGPNGGVIVNTPDGPIETFSSTGAPPPGRGTPPPPQKPWWAVLLELLGKAQD